jgi:transcriptional regulator with XRE-family HTH domain
MSEPSLGTVLSNARADHGLSLQEVATHAKCSSGYVHKLEADRVRSPSPRVLAGLARALGLAYADLMSAAGYDATPSSEGENTPRAQAVKRYSNAHIVQLIEQLQHEVAEVRTLLEAQGRGANH